MIIRKVPVSEINPATYNPRVDLKPSDPEYQKLKKSIDTFGYIDPIVWNEKTGNLVGGHQRLKILIAYGLKEIEASIVSLGLEKEKLLNLALNKASGLWDEDKLAALLDELMKMPDLDISISGFDLPEISHYIDQARDLADDDDLDYQKEAEAIITPETKEGELIILGPHRILCGDSANPEDLARLMNGEKADMVDTDYPYNVNYGGGDKPDPNTRPKDSRKWPQIYADNMPQAEYEIWMKKVLTNIKHCVRPGAAFYIWQGLRQIPPLCQSLIDLNFHVSCIICWLKESPAITYADYCYRTEQCLYGWLEGAPHYWAGKPAESNVWEVHRDSTKAYSHPTQKPVQLGQHAIRNSSKINDIVLDVFLGGGGILLAAESLGRRCYGCDRDARYIDVCVKRYGNLVNIDKLSPEIRERYFSKEVTK
ncbi:MAG: DNA methyltransferase [Candidatus Omnitrophota bacterium]